MERNTLQIRHLFLRAGFGLSPGEWQRWKLASLEQAVEHLFSEAANAKQLQLTTENGLTEADKKERRKADRKLLMRQNADWVAHMASGTSNALLEKMSLFWHGHFACIQRQPKLAAQQLRTIRQHALGSFRDLVHAISKDPAMIRFLNNQQNKKAKPNENFARELMELFTIGRGNYTEQDIKEAARAFTGWSSTLLGKYKFRRRQHDFGPKVFMGHKGRFNGDEIIDIILEQPATARFIVRKIYRYFVNEQIDEARVEQLAETFYADDYHIGRLMRRIFTSSWFYAPVNIGRKIKSPIELMVGIMRTLQVEFDSSLTLIFIEKALGQILFRPPNVAGWPGGKSWIDNSSLMLRLNLVGYLFQATDVNFRTKAEFEAPKRNKAMKKIKAEVNLQPLLNQFSNYKYSELVAAMSTYLLPPSSSIDPDWLRQFTANGHAEDQVKSVCLRLMSLPEYQLC